MGSYIYLEPQMIAIFEGQPPQNKAELPLKTRDDGSFGFHIYIYRFIYIHGGGWLNHRLVHQGWITSSLGWCKPRDRICTAPKVFGDPGFWGDFFGSLESLRKTAWLDLYHIMICIYIYLLPDDIWYVYFYHGNPGVVPFFPDGIHILPWGSGSWRDGTKVCIPRRAHAAAWPG